MVGGHQFSAPKVQPLTAKMGNAAIGFEQCLRSTCTEANDHLRSDRIELPQQERRAGFDFVGFGQAIFRRSALHDVADVDVFALQTHRFDHLREQFPGAPDERQALRIFVAAWSFADKDKLSFGTAVTEDDFVPRAVQFAARALAEIVANLEQRVVCDPVHGIEQRHFGRGRKNADLLAGGRGKGWGLRNDGLRRNLWQRFLVGDWDGNRGLRHNRCAAGAQPVAIKQTDADVFVVAQPLGEFVLKSFGETVGHDQIAVRCGECSTERRRTTSSRTRCATSLLFMRGRGTSRPSRANKVTMLVSWSKPAPSAVTSLATIRSAFFAASFLRAFSATCSVSAAKPTTRRSPLLCATSARMSRVGSRDNISGSLFRLIFWSSFSDGR